MDANKSDRALQLLLSQFRDTAMFEGYEITSPESHGNGGDTPLHVVALDGDIDLLNKMMPFVKDIDVSGDCGYTPLHYAVIWMRPEIAKILIKHGADPTRKNDYGDSPLMCMKGKSEFDDIYHGFCFPE